MADESTLRDQIDRGERASVALKELQGAMEDLEKKCFETFRNSDMHDDIGRRSCRYYLRVLDDVRQRFELHIRQGKDANKQLIRLKDPSWLDRKAVNE